ncbi:hypothetical protein [Streptomyces olivaceus]|uniref:hypothetical protein n=1 Tax=Streptomyces olivaceus TaxID=47716 RepID=UPI001CCE7431|nr:hypothetical protein [Streptomyces olivaceus]
MSDAAQPTAAEVRAAAEAVKTALDRHLAAVERRSGEDDPAVYDAFNQLAAAAEAYDELLYDRYDEVTPFEIPGADDTLPPYTGPEEPSALSVLIRRDYAVAEPQRLMAHARRIEAADEESTDMDASGTVHGALSLLFGEFEPDEIASRHKEFGLEEGDSTLWVTAADEAADPGEWLEAPFEQVDPQSVVCRFDVSAVFDDDLDDEEDGGDADGDAAELDEDLAAELDEDDTEDGGTEGDGAEGDGAEGDGAEGDGAEGDGPGGTAVPARLEADR